MKYIYALLLVIGLSTLGFSQVLEDCIVLNKEIINNPIQESELRRSQNSTEFEPITFNIFFWGFRLEDNTGNTAFTLENIENAVSWLNTLYNQCNISFVLLGHDTILSNEFYKLENPYQFSPMLNDMREEGFVRTDAFNVYVSNEYSGFGGIAEGYHSTFIGIPSVQLINSGAFEHEVGHCFNLLHTNESNSTLNCESAVRDINNQFFNADIAGDLVIDTAAGYIFEDSDIDLETCTVISGRKDCFGFPFKIPSSLLHNFMTIQTRGCTRDQLTSGQFLRIRQAIELDPYLEFENATVD